MRLGVQVREALPGDMESLVALCLAARREAAVGAQLCTDDADRLRDQLGALLAVPRRTRAAWRSSTTSPAGLLLARVVGPGPFTDLVSLDIEAIYVLPDGAPPRPRARAAGRRDDGGRRGRRDRDVLVAPARAPGGCSGSWPGSGFAPAASHRVVTTAALQRKLTHEHGHVGAPGSVRRSGPRGLEDLIARRRQARAARQPVVEEPVDARAGVRSGSGARVDHHAGQPCRAERPAVLVLDHHLVGRQAPSEVQRRRGPGDEARAGRAVVRRVELDPDRGPALARRAPSPRSSPSVSASTADAPPCSRP